MKTFYPDKRFELDKAFLIALVALILVHPARTQDTGSPAVPNVFKDYVSCQFSAPGTLAGTVKGNQFVPPKDVLCSFSLLEFKEASDIFGKRIATTYVVIQVVVRNLNQKNDFLLHDVQVQVPVPPGSHLTPQFRAGRDKLLARGVSIKGQSMDTRNLIMGGLDTLSATAGAISLIGASMSPVSAAFQGLSNGNNVLTAFLPPLKRWFPDYTVDQLNRLNDLGFSASSNYKIIVPKGGAIPFVTFIPQELFDKPVRKWSADEFLTNDSTTAVLVAGALIQELTSAPSISALSPASGPPETPVTITGTNFGDTQGGSSVKIGGNPVDSGLIRSWSATSIVVTIPSGIAIGPTSVVVSVSNVDSASQTFTVGNPPSITTQPMGTTVDSGQTAPLSVTAAGTAPLSYQWYQGNSGDTHIPVSGATASSFTTPSITADTNYWVQVSNSFGGTPHTANSTTATVTVGTAPTITTQPLGTTINSGQTAPLSVIAVGTPPLSYQWYQGTSGDTHTPVGGATASSFTTPPITASTSYWVQVSSTFGGTPHTANSTAARITVGTAPTITTQPMGTTVNSGQTAPLSVTAAGTPPLSYQWYQGNSGDTTAPVSGATASSFTTPSITANTNYWVQVSNTFAGATHTVNSTTAAIAVH